MQRTRIHRNSLPNIVFPKITAIISSMRAADRSNVVGPRRITEFRRVPLPVAFSEELGIKPNGYVTTTRARNDRHTIMIRPCEEPAESGRRRDIDRPRRVDTVRQVAFPAELLKNTGLAIGSLVSFSLGVAAIKMFSSSRVVGPLAVTGTRR